MSMDAGGSTWPSRAPVAIAVGCATALLLTSGLLLSAPKAEAAATVTVEISGFAFQPATVTIQVGDTVTWTNFDAAAHTATDTGSQSLFDGVMGQGESFSYRFTDAGTFNYLCTFHPEMKGTVVVQDASEPAASQLPDGAMPRPGATSDATAVLGGVLLVLSLLVAVGGARLRRPGSR